MSWRTRRSPQSHTAPLETLSSDIDLSPPHSPLLTSPHDSSLIPLQRLLLHRDNNQSLLRHSNQVRSYSPRTPSSIHQSNNNNTSVNRRRHVDRATCRRNDRVVFLPRGRGSRHRSARLTPALHEHSPSGAAHSAAVVHPRVKHLALGAALGRADVVPVVQVQIEKNGHGITGRLELRIDEHVFAVRTSSPPEFQGL